MRPGAFRSTIRIIFGIVCIGLLAACRSGSASLSRPTGVAAAADGSLYVMDHTTLSNSRVVHITAAGKVINSFKPEDPEPGRVYAGWDMAVGPTGNVYYCNLTLTNERPVHDGVMAYNPDGDFLFEIGAADYALDSSQISALPYNLDVDNRGWIYITDFNYNQLRVFDPHGQLLASFNADNMENFQYRGIGDVVLDDQRNLLYLTDFFTGKLDQYRLSIQEGRSLQLALQFTVGAFGHGPGEFSFPQYLAVDEATGIVYVGDMGNRRIQAVDPQGNFVAEFSPPVDEWQVLGLAIGVDAEQPGGKAVYAADALNQVIWAFTLDGHFLRKIEVH